MAFSFYLYGSVNAVEIRIEEAKGDQKNPKQLPIKENKIFFKKLFIHEQRNKLYHFLLIRYSTLNIIFVGCYGKMHTLHYVAFVYILDLLT